VPNDAIVELVKGVFGLKESPRLWWLKLRDAGLDAGFVEVRSAPGTFRVLDKAEKLVGMLVVHVDDGVWAGSGPAFVAVQKRLRGLINIKVEKKGQFDVLGRHVTQTQDGICVQQWEYLAKMQGILVARARRANGGASLTPQERTQYLSLVQQLAWPARTTLPGLCFLVSDLQQKSASATVADLVRANWVLKQAQAMGRAGACLWFRPILEQTAKPVILAVHDASFAQQPGHGSQSGYLVMRSTENILKAVTPEGVHLLDWASNKIHRVVRSTQVAEAASASHAHDRGT